MTEREHMIQYDMVHADDGCMLATMSCGPLDAPVLLFVHGLSQGKWVWKRQFASALARRFRMIAFDLRGHGASSRIVDLDALRTSERWAADISDVLRHHAVGAFIGVGWSYGALVLLDYLRSLDTAKARERIRALVLVGSGAGLTAPRVDDAAARAGASAYHKIRAALTSPDFEQRVSAIATLSTMLTAEPLPREERDMLCAMALSVAPEVRSAMTGRPLDNRDLIGRLTMPLRFFAGAKDGSLDLAAIETLASHLPHAGVDLFRQSGHSPFIEEQGEFEAALARLAERV